MTFRIWALKCFNRIIIQPQPRHCKCSVEILFIKGALETFHNQVINYLEISIHKLGLLVNTDEDSSS